MLCIVENSQITRITNYVIPKLFIIRTLINHTSLSNFKTHDKIFDTIQNKINRIFIRFFIS